MDGKKLSVFFGVFIVIALMAVLVSAYGMMQLPLDIAIQQQAILTLAQEEQMIGDFERAGYDVHNERYSAAQVIEIVYDMANRNDEGFEADWDWIRGEMNCFVNWYYNERQPGEIFEAQGYKVFSYCSPPGVPPYEAPGGAGDRI